jgi:hypothetical protein
MYAPRPIQNPLCILCFLLCLVMLTEHNAYCTKRSGEGGQALTHQIIRKPTFIIAKNNIHGPWPVESQPFNVCFAHQLPSRRCCFWQAFSLQNHRFICPALNARSPVYTVPHAAQGGFSHWMQIAARVTRETARGSVTRYSSARREVLQPGQIFSHSPQYLGLSSVRPSVWDWLWVWVWVVALSC